MNNKYLEFYKPFLESIDSGKFFLKPFGWLYAAFAGFNLLVPFEKPLVISGDANFKFNKSEVCYV